MARRADTPRDLLLGLLALQTGMVNQAQLVAAFQAWSLDKSRPMGDLLVEHGALDDDGRDLLTALARKHLEIHRGDPEKSLASLGAGRSTRESLAGIGDPEIDATMAHVGSSSGDGVGESDRTTTFSVGTSTSDGQRFRILRPHATGGLGAVFVALDGELHREVALKQIQDRHADDPVSRGRFLVEAEITGGLEHPGIVPVYGLGTYSNGRPYYAMRFIRGDSLKEAIAAFHGDEGLKGEPGARGLELRKLLRRFLDVCNAIEYAHRRGVLHRDLKPGNVMVGKYGETLVVDWGLAKAVGRVEVGKSSEERTLVPSTAGGCSETLPGSLQGTPAYMSPEQAIGDIEHLGSASDVYSLGATLFCLLTGRPPFEGEDLGAVLRAVQKGEFPHPRALDRSIAPALEAICLKAMALNPGDRYATPMALAEDVDRWMADEPVSARREPVAERGRRWMRKRRTTVTAAAVAVLVGVVGLVLLLVVQARANRDLRASNAREVLARDQALARFDLALEAIGIFHTGVSEDLLLKEKEFDALRTKLLRGAREFYGKLGVLLKEQSDQPSQKALGRAGFEVAELTAKISSKAEALAAHREALAVREALARQPGADAASRADVAHSLGAISSLQTDTGEPAEALKSLEAARSITVALVASDPAIAAYHADLARCDFDTGNIQEATGRRAEALASFRQALTIRRKLTEAHPDVTAFQRELAWSYHKISVVLSETGRRDEAMAALGEALAIRRKLAEAHPAITGFQSDLAWSLNNHGVRLAQAGRRLEALAAHERALTIRLKLAADYPAVTAFQSDLAWSYNSIGAQQWETARRDEAMASFQQALAIRRKLAEANPTVTPFQIDLAMSLNNYSFLLSEMGRRAEALAPLERALAIRRALAEANPAVTAFQSDLGSGHNAMGVLLWEMGRRAEAIAALERALAIRLKLAEANPTVTAFQSELAWSENNHGVFLAEKGRRADALAAHERALAIRRRLAEAHPTVTELQGDLAISYDKIGVLMGLAGEAVDAIAAHERALAIRRKLAADYPTVIAFRSELVNSYSNIGDALRTAGRLAEARASYERGIVILEQLPTPLPSHLYELACVRCLLAGLAGKPGSGLTETQGRAHVDEAMATLRRAVAAGYRDAADMRRDIHLDPLRSRPDFQDLMLDLEFPSDPFGG